MKEYLYGEACSALEGVEERHALGGVAGLSIRARSFIFVGLLSMTRPLTNRYVSTRSSYAAWT
jgi:hypothetical protein